MFCKREVKALETNKSLLKAVKAAAHEAIESDCPCDLCFGRVKKNNDEISVWLTDSVRLSDSYLLYASGISKAELSDGDVLVMIRARGGCLYYAIDVREGS
jgi:hypothetical protein